MFVYLINLFIFKFFYNRDKISDLEIDKRELVGVFGKIGVGKSFLINVVIGEKNFLFFGSISVCIIVMIKVEINM